MDHVWGSAPVLAYWDALARFLPLHAAAILHVAFPSFDQEAAGGDSLFYMFLRASLHGPWLVDQHALRGSWRAVFQAFAASSGALSSSGPLVLSLGPGTVPATIHPYGSGDQKQAVLLGPGCAKIGDLVSIELYSIPLRSQTTLRTLPEPPVFSLPFGGGSGRGALCYLITLDDDEMPYGHYRTSGYPAGQHSPRCVAQVISFFAFGGEKHASTQPHGSSWSWQPCPGSHTGWTRGDHLRLPRARAPVDVVPREPNPEPISLWRRRLDDTNLRAWVSRALAARPLATPVPACTPPSLPGPPRKRSKDRTTVLRSRLADLGPNF